MRTFHTVSLPPAELVRLAAIASAVLWAEEARKALAGWLRGRKPRA
jgi:hypothetical protein